MRKILVALALMMAFNCHAGWRSFMRHITHPFSGSFAEKVVVNPAAKLFGGEFANTYIAGLNLAPGVNGDSNVFAPYSPTIASFSLAPTSPVNEPAPWVLMLGAIPVVLLGRKLLAKRE